MLIPQPSPSFVPTKDLGFDVHGPLLSRVFSTVEFKHWLSPRCPWQLCFVGGPGSGKTTLSILTIAFLQNRFRDQNICVASIFLTGVSSLEAHVLIRHILLEVWRQLSAFTCKPHARDSSALADDIEGVSLPATVEGVRNAIFAELLTLEHAYLVFDDVDLFDQSQHQAIEAELVELQRHGVNVMTTSRLSIRHKTQLAYCDNESAHETLTTCSIFWCCTCQDGAEEIPTICQSCIEDGYRCPHCGQTTNMREPYDYLDLSIECDDDIMADYIATSLELAHGDLGLKSSALEKPPHSRLGRALVVSQNETATTAKQLQDKITRDAEGNIAMAKIRVEACEQAKSIEEAFRYGDRLPGAVVALFDAGVARIQTMPTSTQELGLKAIVGVATEFHNEPYEELERWLRQQVKGKWLPDNTPPMQESTIETVLRAAAGFLVVDSRFDRLVSLYHGALGYYATERYNESLFWIHTSINTMHKLEAEPYADEDPGIRRPIRTRTWHVPTRRLAYTRTA